MTEFFRRIRYLLNRNRLEQELADDMEFHREMAARGGRDNFGSALRLREDAREAWGWMWIDRMEQDLRYSVRMLRRAPGFTLAAVLMLAVGIGVNVAAFGFVNLMILRPLPLRHPETLLQFQRSAPGNFANNFPYPAVAFYREHSRTLSAVLALNYGSLTFDGEEKPVRAHFVTGNFFSELAGPPALGRMIDPAYDEAAGAQPVVVLSYGFWHRHFGADPSIAGRVLLVNGRPVTVLGVAAREFSGFGLTAPDVWAPISQQPYFSGGTQSLHDFSGRGLSVQMWGRVAPGSAPRAAEAELASLAAELHQQHPDAIWKGETLPSMAGGFAATLRPEMAPALALLAAVCLLILVVACGNLGSLLLARGTAREREIAIRIAVGAGRSRLTRQLFTESLVLAGLGLAAGLVCGSLLLRALILATGLPPWLHLAPDWRVVAFAVSVGFTAALLFGLMPSMQVARQRHRAGVMRQLLIGAQVAASCVLVIAAGLLVRALQHATYASPGFEYQQVISIDPALRGYTASNARVYFDTLYSRLRGLPGVESVGMASNPPLGNRWTVFQGEASGHILDIHINHVDPSFFPTMGIPILRGSNLTPGDRRAIVVSESFARLRWPGEDPVGKTYRLGEEDCVVAGVSGSARLVSPEDSDAVEIYKLAEGGILPSMVALVRISVAPEALVKPVASVAKAIDPRLSPDVRLMRESFRAKVETARYAAIAVSLPGLIALLLACLGIVGLVAYAVSQRTREIGIRMALGASPTHILQVIARRLSLPILAGLIAGLAGAAALSRVLRSMLFGVSNLDPATYGAATVLFGLLVTVAVMVPARRALKVDPMRALRHD